MAAMIWDPALGAWQEAATPQVWDPALEAYEDTRGLAWNPELGAWEERWDPDKTLWLYNHGDECGSVTGGWAKVSNYSYQYGSWEKRPGSLYVKCTYPDYPPYGNYHPRWATQDAVDVTKYSRLRMLVDVAINWAGDSNPTCAIVGAFQTQIPENGVFHQQWATVRGLQVDLDITGLAGRHYILLDACNTLVELAAYQVWLE